MLLRETMAALQACRRLSLRPDFGLAGHVRAGQALLFPDPRPLVERLGREFFLKLPEHPGVYLMRDAADVPIYVGKAKNLRKRLTSYRVANPERMPARHLRLLRAVARIELEACADEAAALAREAELLRQLRPKFNRAGTWTPPPRFLLWRCEGEGLELEVGEVAEPGWSSFGPVGALARIVRPPVLRLLWAAMHPDASFSQLPVGWSAGLIPSGVRLRCGKGSEEAAVRLQSLLAGQVEEFCTWIAAKRAQNAHRFDVIALEADFELLREALPFRPRTNPSQVLI